MTEQQAIQTINQENLTRINWFNPHNLRDNEVGIVKTQYGYAVYITNERASVIDGTLVQFNNSSDAYDALIRKARYLQKTFA